MGLSYRKTCLNSRWFSIESIHNESSQMLAFYKNVILILTIMLSTSSIGQAAVIGYTGLSANRAVYFIDGEFSQGTADQFERLLVKYPPGGENYEVFLNSPGGVLLEGIKLGLIFRKYGLWTSVQKLEAVDDYPLPGLANSARCASACAISFLGGKRRNLSRDNELGFHRFYNSEAIEETLLTLEKQQEISGNSQIISAVLANYVIGLGDVDPNILILNSLVPPNEMHWLSIEQANALRITNDKIWSEVWLEPYKSGVVAAIRREDSGSGYEAYTPYDLIAQATFFCRSTNRYLMLSGSGLGTTEPFNSQVNLAITTLDGKKLQFDLKDSHTFRQGNNGEVWFDLKLSQNLADSITDATQITVDFGLFGASGGPQKFQYSLSNLDRSKISASFRFCIDAN